MRVIFALALLCAVPLAAGQFGGLFDLFGGLAGKLIGTAWGCIMPGSVISGSISGAGGANIGRQCSASEILNINRAKQEAGSGSVAITINGQTYIVKNVAAAGSIIVVGGVQYLVKQDGSVSIYSGGNVNINTGGSLAVTIEGQTFSLNNVPTSGIIVTVNGKQYLVKPNGTFTLVTGNTISGVTVTVNINGNTMVLQNVPATGSTITVMGQQYLVMPNGQVTLVGGGAVNAGITVTVVIEGQTITVNNVKQEGTPIVVNNKIYLVKQDGSVTIQGGGSTTTTTVLNIWSGTGEVSGSSILEGSGTIIGGNTITGTASNLITGFIPTKDPVSGLELTVNGAIGWVPSQFTTVIIKNGLVQATGQNLWSWVASLYRTGQLVLGQSKKFTAEQIGSIMSSVTNNILIFDAAYDNKDLNGLSALLDDSITVMTDANTVLTGKTEYLSTLMGWINQGNIIKTTITKRVVLGNGDSVVLYGYRDVTSKASTETKRLPFFAIAKMLSTGQYVLNFISNYADRNQCSCNSCSNFDWVPATPGVNSQLAPGYLSIPDWSRCVLEKSMGTWTALCIPASKVAACPDASWSAILAAKTKTNFGLPDCA